MDLPLLKPAALLADRGYDGYRFRENLLMHDILPIIPPRSNRKVSDHPDYRRYRDRNRIKRMFGMLKRQRRIATRYDKTALSFLGSLNIGAGRLWLKAFVKATRLASTMFPSIATSPMTFTSRQPWPAICSYLLH